MKKLLLHLIILITFFAHSQQKDSLKFQFGNNFSVYKKPEKKSFYITDVNHKIVFSKLKYVSHLGSYIQVLDKKNNLIFIDVKGQKAENLNFGYSMCGTVSNYIYEIIERNGYFIITQNENFFDYNDSEPPKAIDSVKSDGIDKIYFHNNNRKIEINANDYFASRTKVVPSAIIVIKNGKQGLLFKNELIYYEKVEFEDGRFRIKLNGLLGYYQMLSPKYKELGNFNFNLARFKLPNGKYGYVDQRGNEYLD